MSEPRRCFEIVVTTENPEVLVDLIQNIRSVPGAGPVWVDAVPRTPVTGR